jgi:hypothetical protein
MRWIICLLFLSTFLISGCNLREREAAVQEKEAELAQKEQQLTTREVNLQQKEADLVNREKQISKAQLPDSVAQELVATNNPALVGKWNARMTCTETTCTGSAIGDTKTEVWDLSYEENQLVARAMTGENLTRTYTGNFKNNTLELTENVEPSPSAPATKMVVRLTLLDATTLEGQREIIRTGDCRIVYALQLTRQ